MIAFMAFAFLPTFMIIGIRFLDTYQDPKKWFFVSVFFAVFIDLAIMSTVLAEKAMFRL